MKIDFESTLARNLDAGGSGGSDAGAASAAGGGSSAPAAVQAPAAAPPAAAASLADLAARAAQPASAQPNGQDNGGQQQAPPPVNNGQSYLPSGLAETFRGTTDKETIDKLADAVSKMPKAPASSKDYKFEPPPEFTAKFGDMKNDPVMPIYRDIAHKLGLDNTQFQSIVTELHNGMEKAGLLEAAPDYNAMMETLAPKEGDQKHRMVAAANRVNAITNFIKAQEARGGITKAEAAKLGVMTYDAETVMAFEKVLKLIPGEHGLQFGGQGAGNSGYSWEAADTDMADPRYSSTSPKYDAKFRKAADDKMAQLPKRGGFRLS